jgi:hypothetical protein
MKACLPAKAGSNLSVSAKDVLADMAYAPDCKSGEQSSLSADRQGLILTHLMDK